MPQFDANTMRVCTVDSTGVQYDPAAPVKPKWLYSANNFSSQEYCAESSTDVPWSLDDSSKADPAMFTVGNAPMWAAEPWITQSKYPNDNRIRDIINTNPGLRTVHDWAAHGMCSLGEEDENDEQQKMLVCTQDSDCVPLEEGTTTYKMQCLHGVCILDRSATQTCYSHRDCLSQKKWCAGNGKCMDSVVQVLLTLQYIDL